MQRWPWRARTQLSTDVSEENVASTFRVKEYEAGSKQLRWRTHIVQKCQLTFHGLHVIGELCDSVVTVGSPQTLRKAAAPKHNAPPTSACSLAACKTVAAANRPGTEGRKTLVTIYHDIRRHIPGDNSFHINPNSANLVSLLYGLLQDATNVWAVHDHITSIGIRYTPSTMTDRKSHPDRSLGLDRLQYNGYRWIPGR